MKTINSLLCCLVILSFSMQLSAQTGAAPTPTYYHAFAYIKVKPGMEAEYLKIEKASKKLHAAKKAEGTLDNWSLMYVMSPSGTSNEYDYVARNGLKGEAQLAHYFEGEYMPKNWMTLLTPEEVSLVNRIEEIRTIVKTEVWSTVDQAMADDWSKAKILVYNYFTSPEGKTIDDHINKEKAIWKPIHEARIKDGKMKGWVLIGMNLPFGASMPYNTATIDIYNDMGQMLAPWFEDYFKKVHPGKDADKLVQETTAVTTLTKGELRWVVDRLDWKD